MFQEQRLCTDSCTSVKIDEQKKSSSQIFINLNLQISFF